MTVEEKQKSIKDLQRAKGVKDVAPEEKIIMQGIMDVMRVVFENYGYPPLETPILERSELYDVKFGQGEGTDAIQESFRLSDRAGRKLILRNELSTPLAIYIASNPNVKIPFKRYEMGRVFRDGPLKAGRYREFWQCDVDVLGIEDVAVDAEMMEIAVDVFRRLEIPVEIVFNTRTLLNEVVELAGIKGEELISRILISMDKLDKIGVDGVKKELIEKKVDGRAIDKILGIMSVDGSNQDKVKVLEEKIPNSQGLMEIKRILDLVGDSQEIVFVPNLVRGQAYYTGPIYEVYAKDKSKVSCSLMGGGRYDEMVGGYLNDGKKYPLTGTSFGLSAIYDYLVDKIKNKQKTVAQVYVAPIGEMSGKVAQEVLKDLRGNNIKSDMDMLGRNMKKNLNYVNDMGIPFVVIIGEDEVKENSVMLKDMESGEQEKVGVGELVGVLKKKLELIYLAARRGIKN